MKKKRHIVKDEVKWCLENRPNTRNSDKLLWISVCYNFYNLGMRFPINNLEEFHDLIMIYPGEEAIKRFRAQFNSVGEYWPDDPKVMRARKLNEKVWKEILEYNNQPAQIQKSQDKMDLKFYWEKD